MDNFEHIELIGEGTFGKVYIANEISTNRKCAIKKIKLTKHGLSLITIRELKVLKQCLNQHIVSMYNCYIHDDCFFMVLEYLPFDLSALFLCKYKFEDNQIKNLIFQLLSGLSYLHEQGLIHRDVKSSNILLTREGLLKIADFGLSKNECKDMTNQVCTLWYRAPELLLGENDYDHRIDSWSVGCILIEFKTYCPFFAESNEVLQIYKILRTLGAPKREYRYSSLFKQKEYVVDLSWQEIMQNTFGSYFNSSFLHLLGLLLMIDFDDRISCTDAAKLPIFDDVKHSLFAIHSNDVHDTIIRNKLRKKKEEHDGR